MYIVILAFSGFIYYKIVESMRIPAKMGWEEMIGSEAIVVRDINPEGIVEYKNELWGAISNEALKKGEKVKIKRLYGMKIFVERLDE
ncbi:MAG: NfeD family protein [Candidatus Hydrothermarchaeota archaeon]